MIIIIIAIKLKGEFGSYVNLLSPACHFIATYYHYIGGRYDDNDHTMIYDVLKTQAHEWENIGKALGFEEGEIAIIKSNPMSMADAPNSWLRKMLSQWLQWAPGDGRGSSSYASKEMLCKALKKAKLARLAEKL